MKRVMAALLTGCAAVAIVAVATLLLGRGWQLFAIVNGALTLLLIVAAWAALSTPSEARHDRSTPAFDDHWPPVLDGQRAAAWYHVQRTEGGADAEGTRLGVAILCAAGPPVLAVVYCLVVYA